MKTANIAELKNNLSAYLSEVKRGREVLVSERNVPFAKIVPLSHTEEYEAEELELVAKGLISLPEMTEPPPDSFWEEDLPLVPGNRAVDALLEDRYGD
jgi:prevent-host-death family protein